MLSIPAGIAALAIGLVIRFGGTPAGPAAAGLEIERPGFAAFGSTQSQSSDPRLPVGTQGHADPNVRVASLQTAVDAAAEEAGTQSGASSSIDGYASFDERFASAFEQPRGDEEESVASGNRLSPTPPAGELRALLRAFGLPLDLAKRETAPPPVGQPAPQSAAVTRPPLPAASKKPVRTADTRDDSISLPGPGSRTAIYDISAHAVYLPNGEKLEAHSGFGSRLDDPRYVSVKDRGPTPANVYDLVLRKQPFHGVRAIRLIPVSEGKMFGRDGMLAHSYMLGPNGQSNGCVSFSNYPAFLSAFLRGDIDRLVVVEHLATEPGPTAGAGWLPAPLRSLFNPS